MFLQRHAEQGPFMHEDSLPREVMDTLHVLSGIARMSVSLATGAMTEILGVQPGSRKSQRQCPR